MLFCFGKYSIYRLEKCRKQPATTTKQKQPNNYIESMDKKVLHSYLQITPKKQNTFVSILLKRSEEKLKFCRYIFYTFKWIGNRIFHLLTLAKFGTQCFVYWVVSLMRQVLSQEPYSLVDSIDIGHFPIHHFE